MKGLIRPVRAGRPMGASTSGAIREPMAVAAIWAWFRLNKDKAVIKVAFITVRVRDLRILFELLAGPEPQ